MDDFNIDSAVAEIGSGLGFNVDDNKLVEGDNDHGDNSDDLLGNTSDDSSVSDVEPGAEAGTENDAAAGAPSEGTPASTTVEAPKTWRPEAAAEFSKLPAVVQQEILKREGDIFAGIEQYKERASFGSTVQDMLKPYEGLLSTYGMNPLAQISDMMNSHYVLAFGTPEQKAILVQRVFRDYGLDPSWVGGQAGAATEESPVWIDPQVEALQNELKAIKSSLSQQQNEQTQVRVKEITDHVHAFASDPKNVYFDELANDIAHLLRTGAEPTVEKAYETAIWRNPAVRAKELTRQQTEREAAERKSAQEKAEAARKAVAANVRSSAKRGSATTPAGSIDDTLSETLAAINARTS